MNRIGTVIVFKSTVTKKQAAAALSKLMDVLETPEYSYAFSGQNFKKVPFKIENTLKEFNDEHGSPVFYIP